MQIFRRIGIAYSSAILSYYPGRGGKNQFLPQRRLAPTPRPPALLVDPIGLQQIGDGTPFGIRAVGIPG